MKGIGGTESGVPGIWLARRGPEDETEKLVWDHFLMLNVTLQELGFTLSVKEVLESFAQGLDVSDL